MPEILLGIGATAVNNVDRNSCLPGAQVLVKRIQAINKISIYIEKQNKVEKDDISLRFFSHRTLNPKQLNLAQVPVQGIIFFRSRWWGENGKPFCVSCSMKPIGKQEEVRLPWRWQLCARGEQQGLEFQEGRESDVIRFHGPAQEPL